VSRKKGKIKILYSDPIKCHEAGMKDTKEIIDLLEKIFVIADNDEPPANHGYPIIMKLANQAIILLKHQPMASRHQRM